MQRWFFLSDWKWKGNFLMADFSQIEFKFTVSQLQNLEVTTIELYTETQPLTTIIALVQATISSLDHCNSFLKALPAAVLDAFQSLLNTASKVILVPTDDYLWTLHWLPSSSERVLTRLHMACPSVSLWSHPLSFPTLLTLLQPHGLLCCLLNTLGTLLPLAFAFVISSALNDRSLPKYLPTSSTSSRFWFKIVFPDYPS